MCFLNQKAGLNLAKTAQANKQKPVNWKMGAAGRSHNKMRTIISLVLARRRESLWSHRQAEQNFPPERRWRWEVRLHAAPTKSDQSLLQKGGGPQLQPHSPRGLLRAFWRQLGCLCRGLWENPAQMHCAAKPLSTAGRGENKPLSGPEKERQGIKAHRKC